jgi:putative intracellular protease/amidase
VRSVPSAAAGTCGRSSARSSRRPRGNPDGKAVEFDAVVVPGGYAADMMRPRAAMAGLVKA